MTFSDDLVAGAARLVGDRVGLDFPGGRRADLRRALASLSGATTDAALAPWLERLRAAPDTSPAWQAVVSALTVRETYFLRDPALFAALERQVLPALIAECREAGRRQLRLWSAGCATGEEPYSLAIVLSRLLPDLAEWSISILGTDIDHGALAAARRAEYRPWSLRATPAEVRAAYFRPAGAQTVRLVDEIRRMVTFAPLNLASDRCPWPADLTTGVDVLLCRNVLMYLRRDTQRAVVCRLAGALAPGGWLAVAPAESVPGLLAPLRPAALDSVIVHRRLPPRPEAPAPPAEAIEPEPMPARASAAPPYQPVVVPARDGGGLPTSAESAALVRALADQGRLDDAHRRLRMLPGIAGLGPDVLLLAAAIELERDDLDAALVAVRRAIYVDGRSVSAYVLLATLLRRRGRPRAAARAMQVAAGLARARPPDEAVPGADGAVAGVLARRLGACLARSRA